MRIIPKASPPNVFIGVQLRTLPAVSPFEPPLKACGNDGKESCLTQQAVGNWTRRDKKQSNGADPSPHEALLQFTPENGAAIGRPYAEQDIDRNVGELTPSAKLRRGQYSFFCGAGLAAGFGAGLAAGGGGSSA